MSIFPDRGDRYLDLVYDDAWLTKLQHLDPTQPSDHRTAPQGGTYTRARRQQIGTWLDLY